VSIPLARHVARFSQRVTNRLLDPIVWHLPGFGRIAHLGRRTGRLHRAPMMAFPSRDGRTMAFALTYGPDAEWVRNALAAGWVDFESRRGRLHLVRPRVVRDPRRRAMPWLVRPALALLRVDDFLEADVAARPADVAREDAGPVDGGGG
jgi:deazaflavin-dependent oxidoreductase (nitroreductase family)